VERNAIMKRIALLILLGMGIGCAITDTARRVQTDPARFIQRNCPTKRVGGDEADHIVMKGIYFDERHCYIVGNCWRDANAICKWAISKGIECRTLSLDNGNHIVVWPVGSRSVLQYIDGVGLARTRKDRL